MGAAQHHENVNIVVADICDVKAIETELLQFAPDAILHLAAESHVDRSIDGPEQFIQTNIVGTARLLQVTRRYFDSMSATAQEKFRFLHVSTDEVYGSLQPDDPAFHEATPYDPRSPYSASKASSDHLARAWFHTFGVARHRFQLLQQLWPLSVSGKTGSGGHLEGDFRTRDTGLRPR